MIVRSIPGGLSGRKPKAAKKGRKTPPRLPSAAGAKPRSTEQKIAKALKEYHEQRRSVDVTPGYAGSGKRGAEVGGPRSPRPTRPGKLYTRPPKKTRPRRTPFMQAVNPAAEYIADYAARDAGGLALLQRIREAQEGAKDIQIPEALRGREFGPRLGGRLQETDPRVVEVRTARPGPAAQKAFQDLQQQGFTLPPAPGDPLTFFLRDAGRTVMGIPAGAYLAGKAVVGDTWDLINEDDFTPERTGKVIEETAEGLKETVTHPVRSFEQHPFSTLLTGLGGASAVAGGAARVGALGRIAKGETPQSVAYGQGAPFTDNSALRASVATLLRGPDPGVRKGEAYIDVTEEVPFSSKGKDRREQQLRTVEDELEETQWWVDTINARLREIDTENRGEQRAIEAAKKRASRKKGGSYRHPEEAIAARRARDAEASRLEAEKAKLQTQRRGLQARQGRHELTLAEFPDTMLDTRKSWETVEVGDYSRNALARQIQRSMDALRGGKASRGYTERYRKTEERLEGYRSDAALRGQPTAVVDNLIEGEGIPLNSPEASLVRDGLFAYMSNLRGKGWKEASLKEAWREFNALGRLGILFTTGSYLRNVPANMLFNVLEEGMAAYPWNAGKSLYVYGKLTADEKRLIHEGMGIGRTRALAESPGRGPAAWAASHAGQAFSNVTDKPQRFQAFIHEAGRKGFNSPEEIRRLLKDDDLADLRNQIFTRANRNMVDYGTAGYSKTLNARDFIMFWPWYKGSAQWAGRFVREHPVKAAVAAQVGNQGANFIDQTMGRVPTFQQGVFPIGQEGDMRRVVNAQALNPFTTIPEFALTLENMRRGNIGRAFEPEEFLSPAAQATLTSLTRVDPFTHAEIPSDQSRWQIFYDQLLESIAAKRLIDRYFRGQAGEGKLYPVPEDEEGFSPQFLGEFFAGNTTPLGRVEDPEVQRQLAASERIDYSEGAEKNYLQSFKRREDLHRQVVMIGKKNPALKRLLLDEQGRLKPAYREALNKEATLSARYLQAGVKLSSDDAKKIENKRKRVQVAFAMAKETLPSLQNVMKRYWNNGEALDELSNEYERVIYGYALQIPNGGKDGGPISLQGFVERYFQQFYPEEE